MTAITVIINDKEFAIPPVEYTTFNHTCPLLVRILDTIAIEDPLKTQLSRRIRTGHGNELCFIRVQYTYDDEPFTCLYPIYTITDVVAYPPQPLFRVENNDIVVTKAILSLKTGQCSASCDMTLTVKSLQGPLGDFHVSSGAGFQLRKRLLAAHMASDIARLIHIMGEDTKKPDRPEFIVRDRLICRLIVRLHGRAMPVIIRLDQRA